jgi:hypothetical protein
MMAVPPPEASRTHVRSAPGLYRSSRNRCASVELPVGMFLHHDARLQVDFPGAAQA